jgi:membrane associated rhomboid family serine protease
VVLPIRDENPTSRPAVVTLALIAINLFVYFAVQPHDSAGEQRYLYEHAAVPCEITSGDPVTAVPAFTAVPATDTSTLDTSCVVTATNLEQPVTPFPQKNVYLAVLFSLFLHGSILHVLGNMLFLWIFGNNIEDRMGPVVYAIFYLIAGFIATAFFVLLNPHSNQPLIGASGAIAGVLGAYIVWFPTARVLSLIWFFPLYLPAVFVLGLWFVMQFATNPNEGVAWQAHVGGFVFGALVALATRGLFGPRAPRLRTPDDDVGGGYGGFRGGYPGRT